MNYGNNRRSQPRCSPSESISAAVTILLVLPLLLLISCAGGPDGFESGDLLVMVYSSRHEPIVDASVREGIRLLGRSDSFGRLILPSLPAGDRELLVRAEGYAPRQVSFSYGDPTQILYVSLEPLGMTIGGLLTQGDLRGMEQLEDLLRRSRATKEEIELVTALRMRLENEAGWQNRLRSLAPSLGAPLTGELLRSVEEATR